MTEENEDQIDEFENLDQEFEISEFSAFEEGMEFRSQSTGKVDFRRLIEAKNEMRSLADDISFYKKLDLESEPLSF